MDNKALKVVLALVIAALAYYAWQQSKPETSEPQTTAATTAKSNVQSTTATTRETAPTEPTTLPPNALPECMIMNTLCKQDYCYFGNALNRHNTTYCERIHEQWVRDACMQKTADTTVVQKPVIEGRVFNTKDCTVYPDLPVELRDETDNLTLTTIKTNSTGEYWFEATAGKYYGVYVNAGGTRALNQNITVGGNKRYIVDFGLSP